MQKYTRTERRMLDMLLLGPKSVAELRMCLWDELAEDSAVRQHITRIRAKLRLEGQGVCNASGQYHIFKLSHCDGV